MVCFRQIESENSSIIEHFDSSMYSSLANQMIEEGENEYKDNKSLVEVIKQIVKNSKDSQFSHANINKREHHKIKR